MSSSVSWWAAKNFVSIESNVEASLRRGVYVLCGIILWNSFLPFSLFSWKYSDFFANWCSHCRDLAPTWETLAEVMFEVAENRVEDHIERNPHKEHEYSDEDYQAAILVELPVLIGKVDCVDHHELCMEYGIRAYPTLKFFVDGEEKGDYRGHRTVVELAHFIEQMEKEHKGKKHDDAVKSSEAKDGELMGCIEPCNHRF